MQLYDLLEHYRDSPRFKLFPEFIATLASKKTGLSIRRIQLSKVSGVIFLVYPVPSVLVTAVSDFTE